MLPHRAVLSDMRGDDNFEHSQLRPRDDTHFSTVRNGLVPSPNGVLPHDEQLGFGRLRFAHRHITHGRESCVTLRTNVRSVSLHAVSLYAESLSAATGPVGG